MKAANKYHISNKGFLTGLRAFYTAINEESFSGKLPKISIQICRLDDSMIGYQAAASFCIRTETQSFRLGNQRHNYGIEYLSIVFDRKLMYCADGEEFINLIDYLFHEMIHEYCYLNGIVDCNHETQYHNSYFLEAAENHGLFCGTYDKDYGFNHTIIPNDLFRRIIQRVPPDVWKMIMDNTIKMKGKTA